MNISQRVSKAIQKVIGNAGKLGARAEARGAQEALALQSSLELTAAARRTVPSEALGTRLEALLQGTELELHRREIVAALRETTPELAEQALQRIRRLTERSRPPHEVLAKLGEALPDSKLAGVAVGAEFRELYKRLKEAGKLTDEGRLLLDRHGAKPASQQLLLPGLRAVDAGERSFAGLAEEIARHEQTALQRLAPGMTPEQLKSLLTPDGYQLKSATLGVTGIGSDDLALALSGTIVDQQGREVASLSRHLKDHQGKRTAQQTSFFIEPEFQGRGLADELYSSQIAAYRRMGYEQVELFANGEVGKYAWARQGFDYGSPDALGAHQDGLRAQLRRLGLDGTEQMALVDELEHSWEVAAFKAFDAKGQEIRLTPPDKADVRRFVLDELERLNLATEANLKRLDAYVSGETPALRLRDHNDERLELADLGAMVKWLNLVEAGVKREPMPVGKYTMLQGDDWEGVLSLDETSASWQRHQAFHQKRQAPR